MHSSSRSAESTTIATKMIPRPNSAGTALADAVLSVRLPEDLIDGRLHLIHQDVLAHSRYIRKADFTAIHSHDLEFLFAAYDERFFAGLCKRTLGARSINFRLAPRMTRAGGKTTRFMTQTGEVSYEIAIASSLLFDGFGKMDRPIAVCGLECENRLQALQRVFEHEIVHLAELLCWENSDCTARRFQNIAAGFFRHRAHTHDLVTPRERAVQSGIRVGTRVSFAFDGRLLKGRVNRITKHVTVLVEDHDGQKHSDGLRYKTYYVPISRLEPVVDHPD